MKKWLLLVFGILLCTTSYSATTGFNNDVQYIDTYAQKIEAITTPLQCLYDYDGRTDGQPVYIGNAVQGKATSTSSWVVFKYTYVSGADNANLTSRKTAYGIWDNRASLIYS